MQRFTAREKLLLMVLAVLAVLVLVAGWLPQDILAHWLGDDALPILDSLHLK